VRSARSRFLPSLSAQAQIQGFTQEFTNESLLFNRAIQNAQATAFNCRFQNDIIRGLPAGQLPNQPNGGLIPDCNEFAGLDATGEALAPEVRSAILSQNDVFPFRFTRQPFRMSVTVSLPIFSNFSRNLGVAQAQAQREDLEEGVRARELQVETEVTARFLQVETALRAIQVQALSREAAREQLRLAQDRYRLGSGSALELTDAQTAIQQAETDYVSAVYEYHRAVAALEFAVGRPLR
jgi:outer membrane protein